MYEEPSSPVYSEMLRQVVKPGLNQARRLAALRQIKALIYVTITTYSYISGVVVYVLIVHSCAYISVNLSFNTCIIMKVTNRISDKGQPNPHPPRVVVQGADGLYQGARHPTLPETPPFPHDSPRDKVECLLQLHKTQVDWLV